MHRSHATALMLATLLISAATAGAHDWGTLVESPPTAAELGAVLAVTEQLQAATLAEGIAPALGADALAADWLGWLIGATHLDRRDELDAFADRLVAAGAVAPDERGLAIVAWRHGLEHLALAWDARALGATRARAEQAQERLTDPNLPPDEAVRLSYLASLGTVAADPEPPAAELLERLGALLAAARTGGEKR